MYMYGMYVCVASQRLWFEGYIRVLFIMYMIRSDQEEDEKQHLAQ